MIVEQWLGNDNQLGIDIWKRKYQRNNETFDEWIDRVSGGNKEVANLILAKKFLFGGRILSNRGVDDEYEKTSLSNCYVISPPEDNIESIYDTTKKLARTYSYGGGCGIDISKLSPKGARVRNQAKSTSGAVSFMDTFSQVTEQICQNGRRGALMISIDCTHPDLEDFITIKSDLNKVTTANISVRVSDEFMQAVVDDKDWELYFERPETNERIAKTVRAKDIYHLLCKNNWDYAEPGILFWDQIENYNLLSNNPDFHYAGTNPCAEEPLPPGGSCLLGAINLSEFVKNGMFNFDEFENTVRVAVKALNDVLDEGVEKHPLQEQRESVRDWRQIGLGIMGLADMLIKCGIKYGSQESIDLCDRIGWIMANVAINTSGMLAQEYDTYPKFDSRVWETKFYRKHANDGFHSNSPLRNSQLLTIAPTGTISTMIGVSGGIEPIFANSYTRMTKSLHGRDEEYKVYTPIVKQYMDENNLAEEEQLPDYFVTSSTISIDERIAMQSVWQSHIDASISSTVNLPQKTTIEDVEDLYMKAWKAGLKGITIYRAGCKRSAILNTDTNTEENKPTEQPVLKRGTIINCSNDLVGKKRKLTTGCGSLHVLAYFDQETGEMQEVFLSKGSTGGCANFMTGLSRTISLLCRAGVDIYTIKDQLDSTGVCPSYATRRATKHDTSPGSCCPMAVGNALVDMYEEMHDEIYCDEDFEDEQLVVQYLSLYNNIEHKADSNAKCPECGADLIHEGGCISCRCGWSRCG